MPITYVGSAVGTNTATMPAHQKGDLMLCFVFRDGGTAHPTSPGNGWISSNSWSVANAAYGTLYYKIASTTTQTVGTFTNATSVVVGVYRGAYLAAQAGMSIPGGGASTTLTFSATSFTIPESAVAWVVAFAGHRSVDTNTQTPPTGLANRLTNVDATDEVAMHDSNGTISSWSSRTVSVGGTSAAWVTGTVILMPTDRYWVGNGGSWSDTAHWAHKSGGISGASVPDVDKYNDVFFNSASFSSAGQTVTAPPSFWSCKSIDWNGVTNNPTLDWAGEELEVYGTTIRFSSGMSFANAALPSKLFLYPDVAAGTDVNLTTGGKSMPYTYITPINGNPDVFLLDSFTGLSSFDMSQLTGGSFTSNNFNINADYIAFSANATVTLGTSILTCTGNFDFDYSGDDTNNLSAANATVVLFQNTGYYYANANQTLGTLKIEGGIGNIIYTPTILTNLIITAGSVAYLYTGPLGNAVDTLTVTNITAIGTASLPIYIGSNVTGQRHTFSKVTGNVDVRYVELKDSNATGGATFRAHHSIDSGNNAGWVFTIPAEELQDNFWDNSTDTGKWVPYNGIAEQNGRLEASLPAGATAYKGYFSVLAYSLLDSYAYIQVVSAGNQAIESNEVALLTITSTVGSNNSVSMLISGNTIFAFRRVAGTRTTVATLAYVPATHVYFRIREAAGTVYFEWSTNGTSWTSMGSWVTTIDLGTTVLEVSAGTWQAEALSTTVIFDNFNIISIPHTTSPSDSTAPADTPSKKPSKITSDSSAQSDASARSAGAVKADTATASDLFDFELTIKQAVADSVTALDDAWRAIEPNMADNSTASEDATRSAGKGLSDTATAVEEASKALAMTLESIAIVSDIAGASRFWRADDSVSASDDRAKQVMKGLADTRAVTESARKFIHKTFQTIANTYDETPRSISVRFASALALSETVAKAITHLLQDVKATSDTRRFKVGKRPSDTASVAESITERKMTKLLADIADANDLVAKSLERIRADQATATDAFTKEAGKRANEIVGTAETVAKSSRKANSDSVSLSENIVRAVAKYIADEIEAEDSTAYGRTLHLNDDASVNEQISNQLGKILSDQTVVTDALVHLLAFYVREDLQARKTRNDLAQQEQMHANSQRTQLGESDIMKARSTR